MTRDLIPFAYDDVIHVLKKHPSVHISFYKIGDGTVREMNCTLNLEVLHSILGSGVDNEVTTADPIAVYDLDKNGWRSFVLENLITIEPNGVGP